MISRLCGNGLNPNVKVGIKIYVIIYTIFFVDYVFIFKIIKIIENIVNLIKVKVGINSNIEHLKNLKKNLLLYESNYTLKKF